MSPRCLVPITTLQIPAVREDGQAVPAGLELGVLLIDAGVEVEVGLQELGPDGVSVAFHEDAAYLPDPQVLSRLAKAWITSQTSARIEFYSAGEEPVPETPLVEEEEEGEKEADMAPLVFNPKARGVPAVAPSAPAKPKRVSTEVGLDAARPGGFETSGGRSEECGSASSQPATSVFNLAGFRKDDGDTAPGQASCSYSTNDETFDAPDGFSVDFAGAGRRSGCARWVDTGPS